MSPDVVIIPCLKKSSTLCLRSKKARSRVEALAVSLQEMSAAQSKRGYQDDCLPYWLGSTERSRRYYPSWRQVTLSQLIAAFLRVSW